MHFHEFPGKWVLGIFCNRNPGLRHGSESHTQMMMLFILTQLLQDYALLLKQL